MSILGGKIRARLSHGGWYCNRCPQKMARDKKATWIEQNTIQMVNQHADMFLIDRHYRATLAEIERRERQAEQNRI